MILNLLNDDRFLSEVKSINSSSSPVKSNKEVKETLSPQFKNNKFIDTISPPKIKSTVGSPVQDQDLRRK